MIASIPVILTAHVIVCIPVILTAHVHTGYLDRSHDHKHTIVYFDRSHDRKHTSYLDHSRDCKIPVNLPAHDIPVILTTHMISSIPMI